MRGTVLKGTGGFYEVRTEDGGQITCRPRGRRKLGEKLAVGDAVTIDPVTAAIESIEPRKNALTRPEVANVDRLLIVLSASAPAPDFLLCDKLMMEAMLTGIQPVPVLNKCDEAAESVKEAFLLEYAAFAPFAVSARTGESLDALKTLLLTGVSCFAGQSAVGKSSLLNALVGEPSRMETGDLSRKTARGRHTTRHAELIPFGNGFLADTPGFSLYDAPLPTNEELCGCYPEFKSLGPCYFTGCRHLKEPGCAVRQAVDAGVVNRNRYERYALLCKQIDDRRKHRYD